MGRVAVGHRFTGLQCKAAALGPWLLQPGPVQGDQRSAAGPIRRRMTVQPYGFTPPAVHYLFAVDTILPVGV